jgi:hypothetical protein
MSLSAGWDGLGSLCTFLYERATIGQSNVQAVGLESVTRVFPTEEIVGRFWEDKHILKTLSGEECTVIILVTPKFHCEVAGEGIKYDWGLSKRDYRSLPAHMMYAKMRQVIVASTVAATAVISDGAAPQARFFQPPTS